jgi:hypothetical protein
MAGIFGRSVGSGISIFASVVFWVVSMVLVFDENYATSGSSDLSDMAVEGPEAGEFQTWMNVTLNEDKIGYTMQSLTDTPVGYILKDYSLIKIPMGGMVREVYLDSYAVLNVDYSLKNFTFGLVSGDYTTDLFGEIRGDKLVVRIKSGKSESMATFSAGKGLYMPAAVPLLVRAQGFHEGRFTLPAFDPFSLVVDELEIFVGELEKIKTELGEREAYRISVVFSGVASTMWVDDNGRVLREEETGGMAMVLTDRDAALQIPDVEVLHADMLEDLAVPCVGTIEDARNVKYLKIRIDGVKPGIFDLQDDFQTIVSEEPLILEIHSAQITSSQLSDSTDFLAPQLFLQVDDPRITRRAGQITEGLTDPKSKAEEIGRWVYDNVEKDLTVSLPSAVDVLEIGKGDCNEHTSLYTALSRASGIPTKICIGIVYKDGFFYYHAWPAVYINGWRPLDPTFGQDVADATHIKLLEGGFDRQADLMRIVGKISVTVLDYSAGEIL